MLRRAQAGPEEPRTSFRPRLAAPPAGRAGLSLSWGLPRSLAVPRVARDSVTVPRVAGDGPDRQRLEAGRAGSTTAVALRDATAARVGGSRGTESGGSSTSPRPAQCPLPSSSPTPAPGTDPAVPALPAAPKAPGPPLIRVPPGPPAPLTGSVVVGHVPLPGAGAATAVRLVLGLALNDDLRFDACGRKGTARASGSGTDRALGDVPTLCLCWHRLWFTTL